MNLFSDKPKSYLAKCSKCGDKIERTSKTKTVAFVCYECKRKRNLERTKQRKKI